MAAMETTATMETDAQASGPAQGLDGVIVAETRLSDVDGLGGRLVIAGQPVEALAGRARFESVCAALWGAREDDARRWLAEGRAWGFARLEALGDALAREDGMDALRAATAHLSIADDATPRAAGQLTGAIGSFAAAWWARRLGRAPLAPEETRGHAEDLLRLALGAASDATFAARAAGLDAYLVTVVDHGMNASTFAARVIASTRSDLVSSIVGALGALKGPLHGGAPGPVLDMLDAIGDPARATGWLEGELAAGRRIMGMGHRIYRVRDPRAFVLERAVAALEQAGVATGRLPLARAVERAAESLLAVRHPDRPLRANVEFYTAVLLEAVGLPRALFTPTFAASRAAGWCAHVAEQRATGRLLRPSARYVGPSA
jgi:citrate synthase